MSDDLTELNDNSVGDDDLALSNSPAQEEVDSQQSVRAPGGRFQPGQSGNRRGRPRKVPEPIHVMAARVLNETVPLNVGGLRKEMALSEAIFRAMCHRAMKDPRLGKEVFRYLPTHEAAVGLGDTDTRLALGEAAFENLRARMRRQLLAELASAEASGMGDNDNPRPAAEPEDAS